ncbi:LAMI_0C11232g1_1 [Lachancea mirantina]|uniref:LAMI_0C11232g1_1 n=1 Tax=Lachancea mirantina TaxID=1230905 RepID=A0A1G4J765_9SACH|nr:LAMI_0C11232g1_1 [Lachancea mirantina]
MSESQHRPLFGPSAAPQTSYSSIADPRDTLINSVGSNPSWIKRHKIVLIEAALFTNVFLAGFDGTITASTYELIGNVFNEVKFSSWITAAYLVTSTSFQPLYGSFSDTLGRRNCLFFANAIFALGCLGCGLSGNIFTLITMRAITGVGGGGLITLSTIINSDIISVEKRGIYQAFQNILLGTGAVIGASCGGLIASFLGWRWCFLFQMPISVAGTLLAVFFVENSAPEQEDAFTDISDFDKLRKIDFLGAILLILGLTSQLIYLTLNSSVTPAGYSWFSTRSQILLLVTVLSLSAFAVVEKTTDANPIIPHQLLLNLYSSSVLLIGIFVGFVAYAYIFTLPLFFQIVFRDSPTKAGLRLTIPSFCTPIGGVIAGVVMKNPERLPFLLGIGIFFMLFGNFCFLFLNPKMPGWLLSIFLLPANIGQGITFPSTLFSFLFAFPIPKQATATSTLYLFRSVGSVWGVACTSNFIQASVNREVRKRLEGQISHSEVEKLLAKLSRNTSFVDKLPLKLQETVIGSYDYSIKLSYGICVVLCFIALILGIVRNKIPSEAGISLQPSDRRKSVRSNLSLF